MNPQTAAAEFWATVEDVEAGKPTVRRFEKASKVLKEHMVATGKKTFEGITLVEVDGGDRLDQSAAMAKLGARLKEFLVPSVRRSLVAGKRPKKYSADAAA